MSEGYVLAIDQGTTGSTVLIFDHDGQVKGRAYSEFAQHYPRPGWVEHDAEEIWQVTVRVIGEALRVANVSEPAICKPSASPTSGKRPCSGIGPPAGRWPGPLSGRTVGQHAIATS
jgi:ribulose kinase